jgi:hypothetical protein
MSNSVKINGKRNIKESFSTINLKDGVFIPGLIREDTMGSGQKA